MLNMLYPRRNLKLLPNNITPNIADWSTVSSSVATHRWMLLTTDVSCWSPSGRMVKRKKSKQNESNSITLSMAQNCVQWTPDGKRCLDLSFQEISTVPKCIQKLCEVDELNLSRNLIRKVPDFIDLFTSISVLDLHSNYVSRTGHWRKHWRI